MQASAGTVLTLAIAVVSLLPITAGAQTIVTEGTNISADVLGSDGRIAFDLLGDIWILPANGGSANPLANTVLPARTPRWSPSGSHLLYQARNAGGNQIWLHDVSKGEPRPLSTAEYSDQQASWHPQGERIVFSSASMGSSGLDLWEIDLKTGLRWRISNDAGDETYAIWSANGQHLAFVSHDESGWSLVLRRHGRADNRLVQSDRAIHAPSWRPDGSLITYLNDTEKGYVLDMVILSDPPLIRRYSDTDDDYFLSPVSWSDRNSMIYTADGKILSRQFGGRRPQQIRFRASIGSHRSRPARATVKRRLPIITPPTGKLVIRAERIFDGLGNAYRHRTDVVIDGAVISNIGTRQNWPGATILDLGNVTILPGFIDIHSALPQSNRSAAEMLAYGITSIVSDESANSLEPHQWHSEQTPGPRLIRAGNIDGISIESIEDIHNLTGGSVQGSIEDTHQSEQVYLVTVPSESAAGSVPHRKVQHWQARGVPVLAESWTSGLGLGVDLLLGVDTLPSSPLGRRYQDMQVAIGQGPVTLVSGLADAGTPGMHQLLNSRQARYFGHRGDAIRRYVARPDLGASRLSIVIGSKANRLPPGLALHAELRALAASGLGGDQVLRAAGENIGRTLGLDQQIGSIRVGALADLVLVSGDPLSNVADTLNIVAVVRNGRFYSLISLLERARTTPIVE